jgi:hypothetical protein
MKLKLSFAMHPFAFKDAGKEEPGSNRPGFCPNGKSSPEGRVCHGFAWRRRSIAALESPRLICGKISGDIAAGKPALANWPIWQDAESPHQSPDLWLGAKTGVKSAFSPPTQHAPYPKPPAP